MIAYLSGQILVKANNYLILSTNNIGYRLFVGESLQEELKVGEKRDFYISHQIREDSSDLYAFRSLRELELFELLLSVSGVGPKSALSVLSIASVDNIQEAIIGADATLLTKVAGIGKKTAERIVLELKSKIAKNLGASLSSFESSSNFSDELDALMVLGYSLPDARSALQSLDDNLNSSDRLKLALKKLGERY